MKFLSKISRPKNDDEDEDLVLDDVGGPEADSFDEDGVDSRGLLGKLFGRRKRGNDDDSNDDDPDEDDPDGDDFADESPGPEEDPPAQLVRLEGVSDVRPVGDSGGGLAPAEESGEAMPNSDPGGVSSKAPATSTTSQDEPEDAAEPAETVEGENDDNGGGDGLEFSLKDIFEEVVEVDEILKDLADSQEEIPAGELAIELKEFLAELED